ncbi:MAG: GNAT family N-acetyltransferase [Gemmatimonadales bacterium]
MTVAERVAIVQAGDDEIPLLAEFYRSVWDPSATPEKVRDARRRQAEQNPAEPGQPPPVFLAIQGGRAIAHVGSLPVRFWNGTEERPGYWIKGLMVLPEAQNGPLGFLLVKEAARRLRPSGALAAAAPARRLFTALGYSDLGAIPNLVQPLAPAALLERLDLEGSGGAVSRRFSGVIRGLRRLHLARPLGGLAGLALGILRRAERAGGRGIEAGQTESQRITGELDALWRATRAALGAAVIRDGRALGQRYGAGGSASPYQWLAARDRGVLAGVAVLRHPREVVDPRLAGLRVGVLSDILVNPESPSVVSALLGAVEREALSAGMDAVFTSASDPRLVRALRRQLYLPIPGNVHFLWRGEADAAPPALDRWWLTRGDGESDSVF